MSLVVVGLAAVIVAGFLILGPKGLFELAGGRDRVFNLYTESPPGVFLLLCVGVSAFVYAASDAWWPPLRRRIGIPDPVPQLEFLWPLDPGQRLLHSLHAWDVVITVRNPSHTQTLNSVRVILEWWMGADEYRAGAYPQPNDQPLQMQHAPQFECTLAPRGIARFRLCRMVGTEEAHSLVIRSRDDGDDFDAGAGVFVFNVRGSADNALSVWDFYEIEATEYGVFGTQRLTALAERAPR